jgi:methionine-rich copper-binding protein CopC
VALASNVEVYFSEPIQGWENAITLASAAGAPVEFTRGFSAEAGNRLLINPEANLEPGTEYVVTLTGGAEAIRAVDDGTPYAGTSFSFTTAAAGGTAPTVLDHTPTDGATDVAVDANVQIFFSEEVVGYGGANVSLKKADGTDVPFTRGLNTSNRLLLNPFGNDATNLEEGTVYEVVLTGGPTGIQSVSGVPIETRSFQFTTAGGTPPPVATVPTVASSTPGDGATDVPVSTDIAVFFSEAIQGQGGSVDLVQLDEAGEVVAEIPFDQGYSVTAQGPRLMIYPYGVDGTQLLEGSTSYRVDLTGGADAIRAADDGTPMVSDSITFTTAAVVVAPTVEGTTPGDGDTGVPVGTNIAVFFSEPIQGQGGTNVTLTKADGTAIPFARGYTSDVATDTHRLMIYPYRVNGVDTGDLEPDTQYVVTLVGGTSGIRSLASGVPLATTMVTFTTGTVATGGGAGGTGTPVGGSDGSGGAGGETLTPFSIASTLPVAGDTDVSRSVGVSMFTVGGAQGVDDSTVSLLRPNGKPIPSTVSYDPRSGEINVVPLGMLPNNRTVLVVLDGVKDAEGNLVPRTVWEFQTADEVKPRVVKFLPKAKGVKPGANLRMWINEQVDVADLENAVVLRELGGAKVAISLTYSPTQRKLVIDPRGRLDRRTTYVVVLKAKFRDAAGNRMDRKVWKFRTR